MLRSQPLYGLVVALLPAAVALAEVVRGTPSTVPWHPLGVIAFMWLLATVEWFAWHEWHNCGLATGNLRAASLYALSLFMLVLLGIHPVFFAVLTGGWQLPLLFRADPDLLYYSLSVGLWIVVYYFLYKLPEKFDLNLRLNLKLADIGIGALFALATYFVLRIYLLQLGGNHPPMHIFGITKEADPAIFFAVGALFTLINALSEELWFRGLLLGALRGLLPLWPAILLQALCFGLAHWVGTPQGILGLLLAGAWGIALGWWTYVRRSIWQALAVHLLADWLIFAYTNG
jgi:membrane protease YdiL (CAAX protease family)